MKTAFLCFFPVFPTNMGSAEVIRSLFLCWPGKKKLFQISHLKNNKDNNKFESIKIFYEKPLFKIIVLPILIFKCLKYLKDSKKKLVIIEGPSWIGYSFISLIVLKIFSPKTKIIYHSHSIEYEVRKMMSSKFIAKISKKLESFVFKYSSISTAVSNIEKNKIQKLYGVKCIELRNGVSEKILKFKKIKNFKFKYIIYSGSYKYLPNKLAIDFLVSKLMPKLVKKIPTLKLVLTGGGYNIKNNFIVNVGLVSKQRLLNLILNSKMMVIPLDKGTGTRIKIIEALLVGGKILTTKKGIEGISMKRNNAVHVTNKKNFYKYLLTNLNQNYKNNISKKISKIFIMEQIVKEFLENKYVKNIIKKI